MLARLCARAASAAFNRSFLCYVSAMVYAWTAHWSSSIFVHCTVTVTLEMLLPSSQLLPTLQHRQKNMKDAGTSMMHLPGPLVGVLSLLMSYDDSCTMVFFELFFSVLPFLLPCRGHACFYSLCRSDAGVCIYRK